MPDVQTLHGLIPHQGRMCLLDRVEAWSATEIVCRARSHLDPENPLRRDGRLASVCGIEYGLQAAAAHGALAAPPAGAGWLAAVRSAEFSTPWLDEVAFGELVVEATLLHRDSNGFIYGFAIRSEAGALLLSGSGTIVLPGRG
jgi:predicted hotdog family 3-hydroxylacyl-ACP dehydratase